jgi:hypothetical protein
MKERCLTLTIYTGKTSCGTTFGGPKTLEEYASGIQKKMLMLYMEKMGLQTLALAV